MVTRRLTPAVVALVAQRFRALGEPSRLEIFEVLRAGERTVTQLTEATHLSQANVSKHLQLLRALGLVSRRKAGLYCWYRVADKNVHRLCDIMCGPLAPATLGRARRGR